MVGGSDGSLGKEGVESLKACSYEGANREGTVEARSGWEKSAPDSKENASELGQKPECLEKKISGMGVR